MDEEFVSNVTASNALSDSFAFEWKIKNYLSANLLEGSCREFVSKLSGGIKFEIIVHKCNSGNLYNNQKHQFKVRVIMKKLSQNCVIKTFLFFEIRNSSEQLYLKDSMEKQFSQLNEMYESDSFEISPNQPVYSQQRMIFDPYGRQRSPHENQIYFNDKKFIIKGSVIFQCCQEKSVIEPLGQNINQLQSDLRNLLRNKCYADIKFLIGDGVMHAHKNILCSRSEVFRKMFELDMKEKEGSTVKITDIEKPVFEAFLNFLYTGTIKDSKFDIIMPLYSIADKYAVGTLLTTCRNLLVNYISDMTVALIFKLADMHNDATLKAIAVDFICNNFAEVEITDSWDTLLNSDPRLASYALKQVSVSAAKNVSKVKLAPKNVSKVKLAPKNVSKVKLAAENVSEEYFDEYDLFFLDD